jgi:rhamnose utilization protein RhaD (predicted bifunctional aldolase and dehydrogenase)
MSPLGSEFDDFLYAPIGEDRNGVLVSVLSALARSDVDPWEEAAQLAQLPEETATQKLTSLIAALPDARSPHPEPETIASRLIALLPRQAISHSSPRNTLSRAKAAPQSPAVTYVIHCLIFMAIVLLVQWLMAGRQAPLQVDKAPASVSGTVPARTPPPNTDARQ